MNIAAMVNTAGANFVLLGPATSIKSTKPVIAVSAIRTGCGKVKLQEELLKPWNWE